MTFSSYLTSKNIVTLKSRFRITRLEVIEMAPFDRSHTRSYSSCAATMAISCIVSEIKRNVGWKALFFFASPFYIKYAFGENGCTLCSRYFFHNEPGPLPSMWLNRWCKKSSVYMQARHLQAAAEPLLRIDRYKAQYTAKITVFALIFLQTYTSATNKIKVESTWVAGYIPRWFTRLQTVTHLWY